MDIAPPWAPAFSRNFFQLLARYSWLSILLAILVNMLLTPLLKQFEPGMARLAFLILYGWWPFSGVVSGLVALCGIPRHGRKGLLIPALTGVCVWILLFGFGARTFSNLHRMTAARPTAKLTPAIHEPGAQRIEDAENGFSFDLPKDYEALPAAKIPKQFKYAFTKEIAGEPNRVLLISQLGGKIRNEHLTEKDLPPGRDISMTTFDWRGLQVDAFRVPEISGEVKYLTLNAQIPLQKRAVQLGIGGPAESEAELRALMQQVLASFEGETNW